MEKATIGFNFWMILSLSHINRIIEATSSCSGNTVENCITIPSNSSCNNYNPHDHLNYTNDIDLMQLEISAMNYIDTHVTNQYCRNYLKTALCVTIYPPCDGGVQKLCSVECDSLLNSGTCSDDTVYLIEYVNNFISYPLINFTINCSNSLQFSSLFLNISCHDENCVYITDIADVPEKCVKFTVNDHCTQYNLATNDYVYQYTSVRNIAQISDIIQQSRPLVDIQGISFNCQLALNLFLCNFGFFPCNLTTGTPKPICSKSCFYFRQNCQIQYNLVQSIANLRNFSFVDDCNNTLGHLEQWYNVKLSSDDFRDDCLDFGLETITDIRLINGTYKNQGRLEVQVSGIWGTVCLNSWGADESNIACRQLGYSKALFAVSTTVSDDEIPKWLERMNCSGNEAFIWNRANNGIGEDDCKVVYLACHTEEVQYGIRLVDGASENEGRLEVQINSVWGTVCDDSWDTDDADVACRQFGYSKAFIADSTTEPGDGLPILFDEVNCNGSESFLWDCANNGIAEHDCRHSEDVFLVCFPDEVQYGIRLVDGASENEGRLEVQISGVWGTICDNMWNFVDADVACRQLGFSGALVHNDLQPIPGVGLPVLFDDVNCNGSEAFIWDCPSSGIGENECSHEKDVHLLCLPNGDAVVEPTSVITTVESIVTITFNATSNSATTLADESITVKANTSVITIVDTNPPSTSSSSVLPVILGCVGGSLLVICIIICIVGIIMRKRCKKRRHTRYGIFRAENLMIGRIKGGSKQSGMTDQTRTVLTKEELKQLRTECMGLSEILIQGCDVKLTVLLAEGEFGRVYRGLWIQKTADGSKVLQSQLVAVKTIKDYSTESLKSILKESVVMIKFDHPNVLSILGVSLDTDHEDGLPFIILPFMVNGDLRTYLKNKRQKATDINCLPEGIKEKDLFDMCYQIACGMNYLTLKRFVHRDLAARNCMVDGDLTIKVADFGLARDVYITDYYRHKSDEKLPVKWMAPEALNDRISNEKTDVWSYGITCWEVFSLGRTPYPSIPNEEILEFIDKGNRPTKPPLCPDNMYLLMLKCWEADVEKRICFNEIVSELIEEVGKGYVIDNLDDCHDYAVMKNI